MKEMDEGKTSIEFKVQNKPRLRETRDVILAEDKYFDCPTAKKIMRRNIEVLTRPAKWPRHEF